MQTNEAPIQTPMDQPMDTGPMVPTSPGGKSLIGIVLAIVVVVAVGGYFAYGKFGTPDAQKLLSDAYFKSKDVKSYSLDNTVSVQGITLTPALAGGTETTITFTDKGSIDVQDKQNAKIALDFDLNTGQINGEDYSLSGSLRLLGSTDMYLKITKFPLAVTKDPSFSSSPFTALKDKWIHIPLNNPTGSSAPGLGIFQGISNGAQQKAAEQYIKDIYEVLDNVTLTKALNIRDGGSINGESTYQVTFELDKEGVKKLIVDLSSKFGQKVSSAEVNEIGDQLKKIDLTGEMWIAKSSRLPMKYILKATPHIEQMPNLQIMLTNVFSDYNKQVTIEAPQGAVESKDIFGGGMFPGF